MVKKYALANHCAGVNFNTREAARYVRDKAPQPFQIMHPAPMRTAVQHQRMQAGVAGEHLPGAAGSGVAVKDALNVRAQARKHTR